LYEIRGSETPGTIRMPPPEWGEHTKEILRGLGYLKEELVKFKDEGVI